MTLVLCYLLLRFNSYYRADVVPALCSVCLLRWNLSCYITAIFFAHFVLIKVAQRTFNITAYMEFRKDLVKFSNKYILIKRIITKYQTALGIKSKSMMMTVMTMDD